MSPIQGYIAARGEDKHHRVWRCGAAWVHRPRCVAHTPSGSGSAGNLQPPTQTAAALAAAAHAAACVTRAQQVCLPAAATDAPLHRRNSDGCGTATGRADIFQHRVCCLRCALARVVDLRRGCGGDAGLWVWQAAGTGAGSLKPEQCCHWRLHVQPGQPRPRTPPAAAGHASSKSASSHPRSHAPSCS